MIICIIPARGGSKGIPKKNIQLLHGKPLIVHSIQQALNTKSIDKVIVSTDSDDIQDVSLEAGATVILRPDEISGDSAQSEQALIHVLDTIKEQPDIIVFLQATSPLRQKDDIQNAIDLFIKEDADSLFSSNELHGFVWQLGTLRSWKSEGYKVRPMRQSMARKVIENGSIYIFRQEVLRHYNSRLGGHIIDYPMHPFCQFQIDTPEDIELAGMINGIL